VAPESSGAFFAEILQKSGPEETEPRVYFTDGRLIEVGMVENIKHLRKLC
jgi:hypothetical protein